MTSISAARTVRIRSTHARVCRMLFVLVQSVPYTRANTRNQPESGWRFRCPFARNPELRSYVCTRRLVGWCFFLSSLLFPLYVRPRKMPSCSIRAVCLSLGSGIWNLRLAFELAVGANPIAENAATFGEHAIYHGTRAATLRPS